MDLRERMIPVINITLWYVDEHGSIKIVYIQVIPIWWHMFRFSYLMPIRDLFKLVDSVI